MNLLKDYTRQQTESSLEWLDTYLTTTDEEALHQLRVSLKKIKAVLHYFTEEHVHEQQISKCRQMVRHIFREAGFIRETQLMISWLKKNRYRILLKESALEEHLLLYTQQFIDDGKKSKKRLEQTGKNLKKLCSEVDQQSTLRSLLQLKIKINDALLSAKSPGSWHELRKLIKQLLYACHWIPESSLPGLLSDKESVYFDQLQEAIGNWHDAENIKRWLSDEQFFLHSNSSVKKQFSKCWQKLLSEIRENEKTVRSLLKQPRVDF